MAEYARVVTFEADDAALEALVRDAADVGHRGGGGTGLSFSVGLVVGGIPGPRALAAPASSLRCAALTAVCRFSARLRLAHTSRAVEARCRYSRYGGISDSTMITATIG